MATVPVVVNIITTGVNSGVVHDGDVVFLTAPAFGTYKVKPPHVYTQGCLVPSGYYGSTDNGALGNRFRHPGTSTTTV